MAETAGSGQGGNRIGKNPSALRMGMVAGLVSLTISAAAVALYHVKIAPKIVAVDLRAYTEEQGKLMREGRLNLEGLRANLNQIQERLRALPANVMVISKEVALEHIDELTITTPTR